MTDGNNTVNLQDFLSAGLEDEAIYRLNITKMQVEERTVQDGDNKGQTYKTISGQAELAEQLGEELPEYPPKVFVNFGLRGKQLERFRKLYVAAFGEIPTSGVNAETGQPTISIDDLAASLVGNDEVWTTYYWKRNWKDKKKIEGTIGWSFSRNPSDLKAPKPFSERDAQYQKDNAVA